MCAYMYTTNVHQDIKIVTVPARETQTNAAAG